MKKLSIMVALAMGGMGASSASAALTFSNISVNGPAALVGTPTITTSAFDIDVSFAAGVAGDPIGLYDPIAPIVITFDVSSDSGAMTSQILSLLGAASGSGSVSVNTVVNSLPLPGVQVGNNVLGYSAGNPPPVNTTINYSQGVSTFRVTHTITFNATNTGDFDIAQLGLIESRFVPAPGSLALLGLGGLAIGRRRR